MSGDYSYVGTELDLFSGAVTWKNYYASRVRHYIKGSVLEVGAGIGGTSRYLCGFDVTRWTGLEPDARLAARCRESFSTHPLPVPSGVVVGTSADLVGSCFDTVIYIDVLEHIEDDKAEVGRGMSLLSRGGHLIALSPAHQWLFSPFDRAVGHYRRYSRYTFAQLTPPNARLVSVFLLDSVGMIASIANRLALRQAQPTVAQIQTWDRRLVPLSRLCDSLTFGLVGKSVVGIWERA